MQSFLENLGYAEVRQVNGLWCGLMRMIFTVGVFIDMDRVGPMQGRICFDTWDNASKFLKEWDGKTRPVVGEDGVTADKWSVEDVLHTET